MYSTNYLFILFAPCCEEVSSVPYSALFIVPETLLICLILTEKVILTVKSRYTLKQYFQHLH